MAKEGLLAKLARPFRAKPGAEAKAAPQATPQQAGPVVAKPKPQTQKTWPARRLNVVERLWGEGYTTPGGAEQVKKLLPLMALDSKKSVLLLGAGLGGINQTMVEETGVWVTGLERDKELAQIGKESMVRAGLKRQAPVRFSPLDETMELKAKSFDAAVSFEGLDGAPDKKILLTAVCEALRVGGELRFTALVQPDTNPPNAQVRAWLAHEPKDGTPHPWPADALQALLAALNMEVRPYDDITHDYKKWVLGGFLKFLSSLSKRDLLDMAQEVVSEAEYWASRVTAIDSGGLKVCRFHAIKLPDKRKSVAELMAKP